MSLQVWLPLNGSLGEKISGKTISAAAGGLPTSGATGKLGPGYTFSNSGIRVSSLKTYKTMSFALWLKLTSHNLCHIIDYRHPTGEAGYQPIYYGTDSQGRWGIQIHTSGEGGQNEYIPFQLSTDIWYHLCVIMQDNFCSLYINGTLIGNTTVSSFTMLDNVDTTLSIGCRCSGTNPCPGIIQDVRVYNHCLSPREVKLLAQGLIAHYKLDGNEVENPNLLNNSNGAGITQSGYQEYIFDSNTNGFGRFLNSGEKCTLTICFTPAAHFSRFRPHLDNGSNPLTEDIYSNGTGQQIITVTSLNNWSYKNGVPDTSNGKGNLRLYIRNTSEVYDNSAATVHWVKLQLGHHPEAITWTPSISENPNQYLLEDDCSGYSNHGTCSSPFGLTSDVPRYKNCKNFENNKYIKCPTRSYEGMKDTYTFSYWAKHGRDNSMDGKMVWGFYDGGWLDVYPTGGYLTWNTGDGGTNLFKDNGTSISYPTDGLWHHYAITGNGSQTLLYIDGNYKGQAITYKSIPNSGTLFLSGWNANENHYRWNGGQTSDFRLYATALSAAAVKELYQSSISFLDNGTLQCSEIVENSTNLKYNQNGITQAELISEVGYTNKMKTKEVDGKIWARIHWLNLQTDKTYFQSEAEVLECTNASNRFSLMKYADKFKSKEGKYEFMLTYPLLSATGYNSWTQAGSPNVNYGTNVGYEKGHTDFPHDSYVGPLTYTHANHRASSMYSANKSSNWWSPIGQKALYSNGIPASTGATTYETELWVRIDNLPKLTKLSMLDDAIQAFQIYEL